MKIKQRKRTAVMKKLA